MTEIIQLTTRTALFIRKFKSKIPPLRKQVVKDVNPPLYPAKLDILLLKSQNLI